MRVRIPARISIHAPREGGDLHGQIPNKIVPLISIHAPREGGDTTIDGDTTMLMIFQSTPPARGATLPGRLVD